MKERDRGGKRIVDKRRGKMTKRKTKKKKDDDKARILTRIILFVVSK